jgi:cyclic lactone autoinducer peptide
VKLSKYSVTNVMKLLALTVVFISANSACAFFMYQDKLPESSKDMKLL